MQHTTAPTHIVIGGSAFYLRPDLPDGEIHDDTPMYVTAARFPSSGQFVFDGIDYRDRHKVDIEHADDPVHCLAINACLLMLEAARRGQLQTEVHVEQEATV